MATAQKPVVLIGPTHHDDVRGPITGVRFAARCGGIEFDISIPQMPPVPDSGNDALDAFAQILGVLSEGLAEAAKNPEQHIFWNGRAKELMPSGVHFRGAGPFSIGPAQSASARALSSTVEMTLAAIVGSDPKPRPIAVQMAHQVANVLGHKLVDAAVVVEARRG
jgi:hypothetical protein